MRDMEHQLQVACVRWFRYEFPRSIIYAIPNGGQRNVVTAAKLKAEGVTAGVPDLFVAEPNSVYSGLYIEMKNGKRGKVSEAQQDMMSRLTEKGYRCEVVRDFDEFCKVCYDYLTV